MNMDDIKQLDKNERELEILIKTVRICSQHIGMKFGIEKCAMLVKKNRKQPMTKGIELKKFKKSLSSEPDIYSG